jgi:chloramphenicol-sensitive protein RarD
MGQYKAARPGLAPGRALPGDYAAITTAAPARETMTRDLSPPGAPIAALAYFIWGLFPLYWSLLAPVPVLQVLAHRALWCAVVVWIYLILVGQSAWWRGLTPRLFGTLTLSGLLISVNWGVYILGVNTGHVLDTSLGYFITPFVNVLVGLTLLRERLNPWQVFALLLAAAGVLYLTLSLGRPPWIALLLAFSFGAYGLLRKLAVVDAVHGLAFESTIMAIPAILWLAFLELNGQGAFLHEPARLDLLMIAGGVVTAVPLVMFAYGARRVSMTALGFLQYIAPTVGLLLGVFVFREPFGPVQQVAFGCIWAALLVFTGDALRRYLAQPRR